MKKLFLTIESKKIWLYSFSKEAAGIIAADLIISVRKMMLDDLETLYDQLIQIGISEDTPIPDCNYSKIKSLIINRIDLLNAIPMGSSYEEQKYANALFGKLDMIDEQIYDLLGVQK